MLGIAPLLPYPPWFLSYSRALTALRRGKRPAGGFFGLLLFLANTTQDPCYLVPTPDNQNARYGASERQPVQTPICGKIVKEQFLTKEVATGTLVPQLLGQPSHLKLVANSPEPRQGFIFAKNVLGPQPVRVCASMPTPGFVHVRVPCALLLWQ